uniref:Fungal STAND N-terminal Goodbye domain-containing protein n=1 Tax=Fusarium oxysporum (strain Fo5176) TaxID=660025 RepID=A0A0D2XRM1_FUSOF
MSVLVSPQGYNLSDDLFISAKNAFIDSLPADTKLASNFGSFFDKLSELLDDYGQKLPRFQEITNLAQGKCSDGFRSTLKNIYMDLFELFTAIAQVFTKKDGSLQSAPIVAWKLSWQPFHIRYQNFLDRLQKHTIAFDDERKFLQLTVAMESQSLQEQHHQLTKEYFALVEESKSRWDTNKRGRIIRKILPAPEPRHWENCPCN